MKTTKTTEWSEGQQVRFCLDGQFVTGEILLATPSTQTIFYASQTYDVHGSKLERVQTSD